MLDTDFRFFILCFIYSDNYNGGAPIRATIKEDMRSIYRSFTLQLQYFISAIIT